MRGVAMGLAAWLVGTAAGATALASGASTASVQTSRGCYVVGQEVQFRGSGFAAGRSYEVSVDGVDFGQAKTDTSGSLANHLAPGGLPAGVAQSVDTLEVTDGSSSAAAAFTLTRAAGARLEASGGSPQMLRAPFQVWGFSQDGRSRQVFLHYVSPAGRARTTIELGRTAGQCGYLRTVPMRVFPFSPSPGAWTLQVDVQRSYTPRPRGASARIRIAIS